MDKKPLNYFIERIQAPIAICDGTQPEREVDFQIQKVLESLQLPYIEMFNLYSKQKDLSLFKTISFFTGDLETSKIKNLFDFNKSNLRTIIVENIFAYDLCRDLAKKLGIEVICFNRTLAGIWLRYPDDTHPFFLLEEVKIPKEITWINWIKN